MSRCIITSLRQAASDKNLGWLICIADIRIYGLPVEYFVNMQLISVPKIMFPSSVLDSEGSSELFHLDACPCLQFVNVKRPVNHPPLSHSHTHTPALLPPPCKSRAVSNILSYYTICKYPRVRVYIYLSPLSP